MKTSTACVLYWIAQQQPCTKLCVKTHSGLSMATVLAAVDELLEQGWILCDNHSVPQGGKPHAALRLSDKRFWGACATPDGIAVASCSAMGQTRAESNLPPDAEGVCLGASIAALTPLTAPMALCYSHSVQAPCALVCDLVAYAPDRAPTMLGDMPSPMLSTTRLDYQAAFAVANPTQAAKLRDELARWIQRLWPAHQVVFADRLPPPDAHTAALAAYAMAMAPYTQKGCR